jgi:D-beta-D-heptose 7-phosphate kinase/D-beta-D-heptose 1-phosphate adenosyltransferase
VSKKKRTVVAVSGGFDPLHVGHIRLFFYAKKLGDKLVVILNNDNWLIQKKGYAFMPQKDRKEILEAIAVVDEVIISSHPKNPKDMSVVKELKKIHPDIFANGGDRTRANAKRQTSSLNADSLFCAREGIKMKFNVGHGGKIHSSSELVRRAPR